MESLRVERARVVDWARVRTLRLASLRQDPDAFGSTLEAECERPDSFWIERLSSDSAATFLASVGEWDAGLAVGSAWRERPGVAGLFGMWVAPRARGRGAGKLLVGAVRGWATEAGFETLRLDVERENRAAQGLYEACGFRPTGESWRQSAPREHLVERVYELALVDPHQEDSARDPGALG